MSVKDPVLRTWLNNFVICLWKTLFWEPIPIPFKFQRFALGILFHFFWWWSVYRYIFLHNSHHMWIHIKHKPSTTLYICILLPYYYFITRTSLRRFTIACYYNFLSSWWKNVKNWCLFVVLFYHINHNNNNNNDRYCRNPYYNRRVRRLNGLSWPKTRVSILCTLPPNPCPCLQSSSFILHIHRCIDILYFCIFSHDIFDTMENLENDICIFS